jgi:hypothetical protein
LAVDRPLAGTNFTTTFCGGASVWIDQHVLSLGDAYPETIVSERCCALICAAPTRATLSNG